MRLSLSFLVWVLNTSRRRSLSRFLCSKGYPAFLALCSLYPVAYFARRRLSVERTSSSSSSLMSSKVSSSPRRFEPQVEEHLLLHHLHPLTATLLHCVRRLYCAQLKGVLVVVVVGDEVVVVGTTSFPGAETHLAAWQTPWARPPFNRHGVPFGTALTRAWLVPKIISNRHLPCQMHPIMHPESSYPHGEAVDPIALVHTAAHFPSAEHVFFPPVPQVVLGLARRLLMQHSLLAMELLDTAKEPVMEAVRSMKSPAEH